MCGEVLREPEAIHQQAVKEIQAINEREKNDIRALLTDEQKQKLDEIRAQREADRKAGKGRHGPEHKGQGPGAEGDKPQDAPPPPRADQPQD